jgi:hypothetical protein
VSHLALLVVFSGLVSFVFALLLRDEPGEQRTFGVKVFVAMVVGAVAAGWLLGRI